MTDGLGRRMDGQVLNLTTLDLILQRFLQITISEDIQLPVRKPLGNNLPDRYQTVIALLPTQTPCSNDALRFAVAIFLYRHQGEIGNNLNAAGLPPFVGVALSQGDHHVSMTLYGVQVLYPVELHVDAGKEITILAQAGHRKRARLVALNDFLGTTRDGADQGSLEMRHTNQDVRVNLLNSLRQLLTDLPPNVTFHEQARPA